MLTSKQTKLQTQIHMYLLYSLNIHYPSFFIKNDTDHLSVSFDFLSFLSVGQCCDVSLTLLIVFPPLCYCNTPLSAV